VLVLNGVLGALVAWGVAHPPLQAAILAAGVALLAVAYFAVERRRAMTLQEPAAKA
jgi:NAD(P)H-hydrate repair Nnr-like enzyme with NAD(P)H-hydrate dehydratase domain